MPQIHKLAFLIVLLLISSASAAEIKKNGNEAFISYESLREDKLPAREVIIEGPPIVLHEMNKILMIRNEMPGEFMGRMGVTRNLRGAPVQGNIISFSSARDKNLIYHIARSTGTSFDRRIFTREEQTVQPAPLGYVIYVIALDKIPSRVDSEEIRQRFLYQAAKDFEEKLHDVLNEVKKESEHSLKSLEDDLVRIEQEIAQAHKNKHQTELALQKKQVKADILSYLYKEKVKLTLDKLEQQAKLEEITKYLDQWSAVQKEITSIQSEINAIEDELSSKENLSDTTKADLKNRLRHLREKHSLLVNNPQFAAPKEQFADVKIAQIAVEKRAKEVDYQISRYEQYEEAEKYPADLEKIITRIEVLENKRKGVTAYIDYQKNILKEIKDHPFRVITKEEYEAMQKQTAGQPGNDDAPEHEESK
jgi:hypothetical protein